MVQRTVACSEIWPGLLLLTKWLLLTPPSQSLECALFPVVNLYANDFPYVTPAVGKFSSDLLVNLKSTFLTSFSMIRTVSHSQIAHF